MLVYGFSKRTSEIIGMWKFHSDVSIDELLQMAVSWKTAQPERYLNFYVRRSSKAQQLALGFHYVLGEKETDRDFIYRMTDQLKRKFGNRFLGFDIDSPVYTLKCKEDASIHIFTVGHKLKCKLGYNWKLETYYASICEEANATEHEFGLGSPIHQFGLTRREYMVYEGIKQKVIFYGYKIPPEVEQELIALKPSHLGP